MTDILDFNDWLVEDSFATMSSSIIEFYEGDRKDQLDKAEEREMAMKSALNFKYNRDGWDILATLHGAARGLQRVPEYTKADWKDMHDKMVDRVLQMDRLPKDREKEIVFFSKSRQQGYVVAYDPKKSQLRIITVFPPKNNFALSGSIKTIMEGVSVAYMSEDEYQDVAILESEKADYLSELTEGQEVTDHFEIVDANGIVTESVYIIEKDGVRTEFKFEAI